MRRYRSWDRFEAAGLTFDALWFLGADDASWPAVARPHPFLTRSLQRTHNMPHADSTADWKLAQQVTARLERSAAKCVFSYPSQNADGVCRPSTLVSSGKRKIEAKALRISIGADEYLAAEDELPALPMDEEQAAILPWPIEQNAGGAEILRRQAACPFQSFATRRLDARPMDATDWGLEARERGSVVHKILEESVDRVEDSRCPPPSPRRSAGCTPWLSNTSQPALQRYREPCTEAQLEPGLSRCGTGAHRLSHRRVVGLRSQARATLPSKPAKRSWRQRWEI